MKLRSLLPAAATLLLVTGPAQAVEAPISVGEITPPPANSGVDAALMRDAAEGEIKQIDHDKLPRRRRVVVSFALTKLEGALDCTVNALVRDAKTGVMIAIIEAGAKAEGAVTDEKRKQIVQGAVRNVVRRIPTALAAK